MILFDGIELPLYARINQGGFGLSKLTPIWDELVSIKMLSKSLVNLASKANIDQIGIQDFVGQALASCKGGAGVNGYLAAQKTILTNNRIMMTDANDTFTRNELSNLGTWPDLLKMYIQMVGGSEGLTLSKTFGEHVSGFNSGDSEIVMYADTVRSNQKRHAKQWDRIDEVLELSIFGERKEITYEFLPVLIESDTQIANRVAANAATDSLYLSDNILTREQILRRLQAEDVYSISDEYVEEVAEKDKEIENFNPQQGDTELLEELKAAATPGSEDVVAKPSDAVE